MTINPHTQNSLFILLWVTNSILHHRNELLNLLHDKKIDIALISEIHPTSHKKCLFHGYKTICTNHSDNSVHGGTALIIKNNIRFQYIHYS